MEIKSTQRNDENEPARQQPTEPVSDKPPKLVSGGYRPSPFLTNENSISGNLDPYLAAFAAGLSELTYAADSDVEKYLLDEGATQLKHFGVTGGPDLDHTYGVGFVLDRRAWIAIRGTNDRFDWGRNLLMMPLYHPGFRLVWSTIRWEVEDWLKSNSSEFDTVLFTGHSLGGAIAKLGAFEAAGKHSMPVEGVITFGAPRVGSPLFARRYNSRNCNLPGDSTLLLRDCTHRFEGSGDVVALVPPFLFGFQHVGSNANMPDRYYGSTNAASPVLDGSEKSLKQRIEDAIDKCIEIASNSLLAPTLPILYVLKIIFWGAERRAHHAMMRYAQVIEHQFAFHEILPGLSAAEDVPFKNKPTLDGLCILAFLVAGIIAAALIIGTIIVCRITLGEYAIMMLLGLGFVFALFLYNNMD